ncbi:MAG: aminotransferase class I/II-fold pyridoxal phosphate-dependent enzyme [Candidatus Vecturithrix sp.]|jgi:aspartate/methionine/tyrosine aminotransferase|nr:aminotransferase class I/II-fold pyridoxal phosphate-dependent enzyme [Candidatus Vecturithrix sp.]
MNIPPFKLERFFAQYEFNVPYLLCCSDCESLTVQELLELEPDAEDQLHRLWLGYTESKGHPGLRREIARLYEYISPEQVLIHAGAEEAIFNFMNAMLERGDHVIVHDPCYQSLRDVATAIGCETTKWTGQEQDRWELDLEFLRQQIKRNTRAIIINCPHNPTGYLMDLQKFQQVIQIARECNLLLFSDEVYRGLEYNQDDQLPAACDLYENAISLGVMSKTYGLAGLRIGWIATQSQEIYANMAGFKDYTSICSSAPSELLAIVALRHKDHLIQRNRVIVLNNLRYLNNFFYTYQHLFDWTAPKAGPIAFPRLKADQDIEAFCLDAARKKGVLLLPSNYYDFGNKHFRIGFGRRNMSEALEQFDAYLQETYHL